MITEFLNCEETKAWMIVPNSNVPKGRKIIGSCWVYAEKDDGIYRSLNVAKKFSQIHGKDFQQHHSPVVHDSTFCVVLVQKLVYNCVNLILLQLFSVDYLDEEIYMEFPEGYEKFLKEHHGKNISSNTHLIWTKTSVVTLFFSFIRIFYLKVGHNFSF
jgi:Reverse transcriptase (RNA-dependent DNA polymerase)